MVSDWLDLGLELEFEIRPAALDQEPLVFAWPSQHHTRRSEGGISPHQVVRQCGAFDRCTGNAEAIGEVAKASRHSTPTSRDGGLGHPRFLSVGGVLIDYQIEWHDPGDEIGEYVCSENNKDPEHMLGK